MKKIFYVLLLALFATVMLACGEESYSFSINVDNYVELRNSIVLELTLNDEANELEKSEFKGTISKKGSSTVIKTKTIKFDDNNYEEVTFDGLTADTEYDVVIYVSYNGAQINLVTKTYKTTTSGTEEKPYEISTFADLKNVLGKDRDAHFILANDIDCEGKSLDPLFTNSEPFIGILDGNGKTIKNLTFKDNSETIRYHGLLGYIGQAAHVFNLTLENFNYDVTRASSLGTSKASYYGVLAGFCSGKVENVKVVSSSLTITSKEDSKDLIYVGGVFGNLAAFGNVDTLNAEVDVTVNACFDATVGGVVGLNGTSQSTDKAVLSNADYNGDIKVNITGDESVDAVTNIGGIVGLNYKATVSNSTSTGLIELTTKLTTVKDVIVNLGGLVGWNLSDNGVVSHSISRNSIFVETFDSPKNEEEKYTLNIGLLAGKVGGDSVTPRARIVECSYELPEGATETHVLVNVINNPNVVVSHGLVGLLKSSAEWQSYKSLSDLFFNIQNYKYELPEGATEGSYVVDGELVKHAINK